MARVTQGLWPRLRILVFTPRAAEFELVSFLSPTSLGAPPGLIFCSFTLSLQSPCPGEGFGEGRMDGQTHGPRKGQPEPDSTPIFLPAIPIKFSEKQQASHHLYVREHRVRGGIKSSWPQKRTLFVLNVPPYCTEVSPSLRGNLRRGWGLQAGRGSHGPPTKSSVVRRKQLTGASEMVSRRLSCDQKLAF